LENQSSKNLVIIPTFNEIENIEKIINAVFDLEMPFHILIVDDGSPDGTASKVKSLQATYKDKLHLIEREGKLGLGTAYITGFRFGLNHSYDYICEMDADFSHNPKDLPRLVQACINGSDMSVGSRYVPGGKTENWPMDRLILSKGASFYVRMITWMNIKDPTAGFVCYSHRVLAAIDLSKIKFIGYAFQIEMKYATKTLGFKIEEVPITFVDRIEGTSKMSRGIIKEAIFGVLSMRIKSFFNSYSN
jgi:dolichol-phosphate mannosyltransferase